ncbi:uncharacterized protein STEHIDRAFT_100129 [Stereum hirsutum FP-91666 SS1]|uniref:uncharacterized protein n=1 Tax=Stereum hirsutum (strain FP-91666) TaxID=721885 RepID=UPI000444A66A|nr:uncharacterized protein STEHIDRAFT_100129 [Stereum hirsutum FP-91666 SS1]EIM85125.1 hypothetical protein STEHIDRAFT_100129 [Stereum hirsutum FP-91666 SS1]
MSILVSPRASRAPTTTEPPSSAYASGAQSPTANTPSTNTSSATRRSVKVTFDGTRVLTSPVDDPDLDIVDNARNEHESSGAADGGGNGGGQVARPVRHTTQQDQDKADEAARKKAMKDLVQSWMDRLQLISLLTTFFAGMEAQLISASAPTGDGPVDKITQTANAAIIGSLVVHSYAAIVSFLAAFALVRYKLKEAKREEAQTEVSASHPDPDADADAPSEGEVGPGFRTRQPPTALLERAYVLSIFMTAAGFVLAIVGIVCYAWASQPGSVAWVATVGCAVCALGAGGIMI